MLAKQSNSAGFRNRVNFDFQFLHIARFSLRRITIDFLVNTLNVLLLGRVPSLTLGYGTLRILPKPRQSTDFFFILKKIINIRVLNVLFPFVERENSLSGHPTYLWVTLLLKYIGQRVQSWDNIKGFIEIEIFYVPSSFFILFFFILQVAFKFALEAYYL